jgi:hypothetical protein
MSSQCVSTDEIIDGYRAAIEHANGNLFASMLQVSFADGWFKVRDLEGTESRYRKKELISLTHSLLKQPEFEPGNALELVAANAPAPQMAARAVKSERETAQPARPALLLEPMRLADKADEEVFLQPVEQPHNHQQPVAIEVNAVGSSRSSAPEILRTPETKSPVVTLPEASRIIELKNAAPAPALDRQLENKTYFRNLGRILAIVAAVFGVLIGWLLLK